MLTVVAPAASASAFRRPSLLSDASHDVGLTLEGLKPQFRARASLGKLDEVIRRSVEGGWLRMLGDMEGLEDLMHVKSWEGLKRWVADHWDIVVETAVSRLGEGVRSELEVLRDMLDDDKIARETMGPALLLIQAERLGVNETTLRYFGAVVSGAIDGDGTVSAAWKNVGLAVGEREIAMLWAAALAAYDIKTEVKRSLGAFTVVASGGDAAKLAGLYFLFAPPLLEGDDRLKNHKLAEAVELGAEVLSVSWERLRRRTEDGPVAADLTISVAGVAVKYNVYLRENAIELQFASTDRSRVELAAHLLRLAGVNAEVKKEGDRDVWRVRAYTDKLAAGREELRKALAEIVRKAVEKGWVDAGKAKHWLEKLERGLTLMEGWPKYLVRLDHHNSLEVRFASPNPDSIQQVARQLNGIGLVEGKHFSMKMPEEGGGMGYVRILKAGLAYAAWLSVHSKDEQQRKLAADFVEYILQRAKEAGEEVYEKAKEIIEKGKERSSQTLENFEEWVEVNGKTYFVKATGWGAEIEEGRDGRKLLRIKITVEVGRVEGEHIEDRVEREYTITFSRHRKLNTAEGRAYARADAPGGREADAERLVAVIKALTGKEPRVYRRKNGIEIVCGREHLEGFMRYTELADAIEEWLEETSRR